MTIDKLLAALNVIRLAALQRTHCLLVSGAADGRKWSAPLTRQIATCSTKPAAIATKSVYKGGGGERIGGLTVRSGGGERSQGIPQVVGAAPYFLRFFHLQWLLTDRPVLSLHAATYYNHGIETGC
jgi:hypothetical protein